MRGYNNSIKIIIGLGAMFAAQASFAYYCSTSSGQGFINVGDTMSQVESACGTPTSTSEDEVQDNSFSTTEYWSYSNVKVTKAVPLGVNQPDATVTSSGSTATFAIQNGVVTTISENGKSVTSTDNCGPSISIGASSDTVLSSCGNPSNTSMQNTPSKQKKKVTTWTYSTGQYSTPLTLKFDEEGKLTSIDG